MALLGYFGFDHGPTQVAADGSSPVQVNDFTAWGYPTSGTTAASIAFVNAATYLQTHGVTIGAVSDASQAMGKAPKRLPLVIQTSAASTSAPYCLYVGMVGSSTTISKFSFGMRLRFSCNTTPVAGAVGIMYSVATVNSNAKAELLAYDASTGTLSVPGSTGGSISLPLDTECYIEVSAVAGNAYQIYVNAKLLGTVAYNGYATGCVCLTAPNAVNGSTVDGAWFRMAVCDMYVTDGNGNAPLNGLLGDVAVMDVPFDTVTGTNVFTDPSTDTLETAMSDLQDSSNVLADSASASSIQLSLAALPSYLSGSVVAAQVAVSASKDSAYTGAGTITPTTNGTAGAALALAGNTTSTIQLTPISDLSSGIPLTKCSAVINAAGA